MSTDLRNLLAGVDSQQAKSGFFETIARHEPKAEPGDGLTAASWLNRVSPVPAGSGLAATAGRVELVTRIYTNMLAEDADEIDPRVYDAADRLFTLYSGNFTLNDRVRNVDLLGAHGEPLQGRAGYLRQRGSLYRTFDIVTPLIINDMWPQSP